MSNAIVPLFNYFQYTSFNPTKYQGRLGRLVHSVKMIIVASFVLFHYFAFFYPGELQHYILYIFEEGFQGSHPLTKQMFLGA